MDTDIILPSLSDTTINNNASRTPLTTNINSSNLNPPTTTTSSTLITNDRGTFQSASLFTNNIPSSTSSTSSSTTTTNSSSILITNGLSPSTLPSPPPLSVTFNTPPAAATTTPPSSTFGAIPPSSPIISQTDAFIKAAVLAALKKNSGTNIGILSCKFSSNLFQNNVADFISFNKKESPPTHILAPFFIKDRIVMAVFYFENKHVGYYDSLKQLPTPDFHLIKYSVEKYLHPLNFVTENFDAINSTFNDNQFPEYANFHICRIAEEICFTGKSRVLKPFIIEEEVKRIKKIFEKISDQNWRGEWISTIKDARLENIIQDVIMDGLSNNENLLTTSTSNITVINGENVGNDSNITQNNGRIPGNDGDARKRTIEALKRKLNIHLMDVYEKKYPTLANMLQIYLNFTKLRFDQYQRDEREPEVKNIFNYIDYIRMNHFDAENGMVLFEKFPYFCELSESDKSALFKRFREPFLLFERIYDTLNIVGSKLDDKYIMLQNGDCFNFATLNQAFMPREMSNVFKIIFSSWAAFLPVIRKMNLEIIEAVYIFCCLLWNTSYLDSPISKDGEEIIRRGRIIIHKEMREFYDYDEIKWERIYSLRHFLIQTEKFVAEYKKQVVVDM